MQYLKNIGTYFIFILLLNFTMQPSLLSQVDLEAKALLDKMSAKLESADSYKMTFDFHYSTPDGSKIDQNAILIAEGKKVRFEMGDQLFVSDGNYNWIYFKARNEVNINDLDEEGESMLSPSYFMKFHENNDFDFGMTNEFINSAGDVIQRVDFKPLNKFSEFKKIGIEVNKSKILPYKLLVLNSDNSRIIFDNISLEMNVKPEKASFVFNVSNYPNIIVEDLRME